MQMGDMRGTIFLDTIDFFKNLHELKNFIPDGERMSSPPRLDPNTKDVRSNHQYMQK